MLKITSGKKLFTYLFCISSPEPNVRVSYYYGIVHTFNKVYLCSQLANLDLISHEASSGTGKSCITFSGWSEWNSGCHGNTKLPLTLHGKNLIFTLAASILFQIAFILADNDGRHKISVMFDYGLNRVVHSGVTCP